MGTVSKKTKKQSYKKRLTPEEKLDRDLKSCMKCKFFWGNDSRCMNNNCGGKKEKPKEKEIPKECIGCPYKQGEGYCFPCMKKILGMI